MKMQNVKSKMTNNKSKGSQGRPGTVSNILWHFPGGPRWNETEKRQEDRRKPSMDAYNNLCSILGKNKNQTKELRLGGYKEIVRSTSELIHLSDKKVNVLNPGKIEIESNPICCLAEIPIIHLSYMEPRYNKFAIGFYRKSVINKFNPVFYTFESSFICGAIRSLHKNSNSLLSFPPHFQNKYGTPSTNNDELNALDSQIGSINKQVKILLSFIKTIEEKELENIYCEREWRSINNFIFEFDDVAMIIFPKKVADHKASFFDKFIDEEIDRLNIPRGIPIVSWEDLIEH